MKKKYTFEVIYDWIIIQKLYNENAVNISNNNISYNKNPDIISNYTHSKGLNFLLEPLRHSMFNRFALIILWG